VSETPSNAANGRPVNVMLLRGWVDDPPEDRVAALAEDPSLTEYVRALLDDHARLRAALERVEAWPLEKSRFDCSRYVREVLNG